MSRVLRYYCYCHLYLLDSAMDSQLTMAEQGRIAKSWAETWQKGMDSLTLTIAQSQ